MTSASSAQSRLLQWTLVIFGFSWPLLMYISYLSHRNASNFVWIHCPAGSMGPIAFPFGLYSSSHSLRAALAQACNLEDFNTGVLSLRDPHGKLIVTAFPDEAQISRLTIAKRKRGTKSRGPAGAASGTTIISSYSVSYHKPRCSIEPRMILLDWPFALSYFLFFSEKTTPNASRVCVPTVSEGEGQIERASKRFFKSQELWLLYHFLATHNHHDEEGGDEEEGEEEEPDRDCRQRSNRRATIGMTTNETGYRIGIVALWHK